MNWDIQLQQIMNTAVLSLLPTTEINHAMSQLVNHRYSGAPVIDVEGKLIGIITQKDCLKAVLDSHYHATRGGNVADYMSDNVITLNSHISLFETAQTFINMNYRRFPVLENNKLAGIVTRHDLLSTIQNQWE